MGGIIQICGLFLAFPPPSFGRDFAQVRFSMPFGHFLNRLVRQLRLAIKEILISNSNHTAKIRRVRDANTQTILIGNDVEDSACKR